MEYVRKYYVNMCIWRGRDLQRRRREKWITELIKFKEEKKIEWVMLKWLKSVFGLLPVLLNDTEWRVWMIFQLLKFLLEPAYNIFVFINISVIKKKRGWRYFSQW